MENYQAKTGKHLIQILMFSMYNDQKIIYREYIQNAFDAINEAVRQNVLSLTKDGVVRVNIDAENREITIKDNGIGIPTSEVAHKLLNIADSHKDGENNAGQYGIGRLAGAGYCRWLKFKTSFKGEAKASIVTFDVDFANQIINDSEDTSSATEVIDAITNLETVDEDIDAHYFEVKMEGVYTEYRDLLNVEEISGYLKEVAPVDYMVPFKRAIFKPSLAQHPDKTFESLYNSLGHVTVSINGNNDLRKRYQGKIEGTGDIIDCLDFFKVEHNGELLAWGWYAVTPFTKQIPVSDKSRGIRLRKLNIQLGTSDALNSYFGETRGNNYFYGEVFAVHRNLRPNSDRSGLAPTPETEILFSQLRLIFKNLGQLYQLANTAKNAVKKVSLAVDKFTSGVDGDKAHAEQEVKSAEQELAKVEQKQSAQSAVAQRVIALHKQKAEEHKKELTTSATLKATAHPKTQVTPKSSSPATTVTAPATPSGDIFAPLGEKLSDSEIFLLRRAFTYMTQACPEGSKKLLEQLKLKAIQELLTH